MAWTQEDSDTAHYQTIDSAAASIVEAIQQSTEQICECMQGISHALDHIALAMDKDYKPFLYEEPDEYFDDRTVSQSYDPIRYE